MRCQTPEIHKVVVAVVYVRPSMPRKVHLKTVPRSPARVTLTSTDAGVYSCHELRATIQPRKNHGSPRH